MADLFVPVSAADHITGKTDAHIVLVVYGDYQCPYTGRAYPVFMKLAEQWPDQLSVVFHNYTLYAVHPQALMAAATAEFAGKHGKFWPVFNTLFQNQRLLGDAFFAEVLETEGLSIEGFKADVDNNSLENKIRQDIEGGNQSGVHGTPSFFINGERYHS